jgi:hypothetical protein
VALAEPAALAPLLAVFGVVTGACEADDPAAAGFPVLAGRPVLEGLPVLAGFPVPVGLPVLEDDPGWVTVLQ